MKKIIRLMIMLIFTVILYSQLGSNKINELSPTALTDSSWVSGVQVNVGVDSVSSNFRLSDLLSYFTSFWQSDIGDSTSAMLDSTRAVLDDGKNYTDAVVADSSTSVLISSKAYTDAREVVITGDIGDQISDSLQNNIVVIGSKSLEPRIKMNTSVLYHNSGSFCIDPPDSLKVLGRLKVEENAIFLDSVKILNTNKETVASIDTTGNADFNGEMTIGEKLSVKDSIYTKYAINLGIDILSLPLTNPALRFHGYYNDVTMQYFEESDSMAFDGRYFFEDAQIFQDSAYFNTELTSGITTTSNTLELFTPSGGLDISGGAVNLDSITFNGGQRIVDDGGYLDIFVNEDFTVRSTSVFKQASIFNQTASSDKYFTASSLRTDSVFVGTNAEITEDSDSLSINTNLIVEGEMWDKYCKTTAIGGATLSLSSGTSYAVAMRYPYCGSDIEGSIDVIEWVAYYTTGSHTYSLKVYDVTNATTIAERTGLSNTTPTAIDMGTISNIPTSPALLEFQFKRDGSGSWSANCNGAKTIRRR